MSIDKEQQLRRTTSSVISPAQTTDWAVTTTDDYAAAYDERLVYDGRNTQNSKLAPKEWSSTKTQNSLRRSGLRPKLNYFLTLEMGLYGLILGLAIFTRFHDLSVRALHHDEGVHAFYSWKFFNGGGYEQEPWKHGPFMYHVQAAVFWLFGDSDGTARVSTALFGVLTCFWPIALRKELGRWGALTASFLLLISPMFLYYSRFLREDIFVAFATIGVFVGIVRFVDRPGPAWWFVTMLSLALLFCTKEVSFFYLALFGGFLVAWLGWQLAPRLLLILGGYGLAALVVFFFIMSLYPPPLIPYETISGAALTRYVGDLVAHPVFWSFLILAGVGLAVAWFAFHEVAVNRLRFMQSRGWADPHTRPSRALFAPYQQPGTVAHAVAWLGQHKRVTAIGLGLAVAFYFVFYTGFFSDIPQGSVGLVSGLWYWMAQQGVARGNQPWYYYFFMLPLYEPLALLLGTLGTGFVLFKAWGYGLRRQYRTVLMPVSELETTKRPKPAKAHADADEDELDEPGREVESRTHRATLRAEQEVESEANQISKSPVPEWAEIQNHPSPYGGKSKIQNDQLVEVEVAIRPAGNALWPGRRRRERHPYFALLLLVAWAWGSLALYTWASEKMPWLTVQLTLPFILLAAYLMNRVWSGIEAYFASREYRQPALGNVTGKVFFWSYVGGLTASGFLLYMVMLHLTSAEMKVTLGSTARFEWLLVWIPPVIAFLFFTALFSFIGLKIAAKATLAVVFGLMTIYTVHTATTFAFDHGDVPLEMGIYTQTAPDTYRVVKELDTVTTILPEQKRTPILYDEDLRTPLDFYLRDYTFKRKVKDFTTMDGVSDSAANFGAYQVLMISDSQAGNLNAAQKKVLADGFISRHYVFHYWFEEGQYRNFDRSAQIQISYLGGKTSQASVKDATNKIVVSQGEQLSTERLQQLSGMPGVLDRVYNANGGNSSLLHLREAGRSLAQLRTPGDFSRLWRYMTYREQFQPLGRREFTVYIKKDIAGLWRQYADLVDFPISRQQ